MKRKIESIEKRRLEAEKALYEFKDYKSPCSFVPFITVVPSIKFATRCPD